MASRSRAVQHDPIVVKMLSEKGLDYDTWSKDMIWLTFRDAIDNPRSPIRQQILEVAEQKIKDEYIETTLKK